MTSIQETVSDNFKIRLIDPEFFIIFYRFMIFCIFQYRIFSFLFNLSNRVSRMYVIEHKKKGGKSEDIT
jgi:hypothetical protein